MNATATAPPPKAARSVKDILTGLQQTLSASRLNVFLQCRLKFYFRYVLALPKPKTPSLHVGSSVHAVLKAWNKARWREQPLSMSEIHALFLAEWTEQASEPVDWRDEDEESEKLTAWRLCETYLRQYASTASIKPDAVEVPVDADLTPHGLPRLTGILDLVQQGVIIDYKTSSTTPNPDKAAHTHEVQTSSYAVLYREATGKRENGIELHHLVKLKNPKLCVTALPPMSNAQQTRLFRLMEAYVKGLERQDFIPSPGMQCFSCEFFNECRQWH